MPSGAKIGHFVSEETKRKISLSHKGLGHSEETKIKMSKDRKGRKHKEESKKKMSLSKIGNKINLGRKQSKETIEKRMETKRRNGTDKLSEETKRKIGLSNSIALKGYKMPMERRIKMSEARRGNRSHLWKGGISKINKFLRQGIEYKLWRNAVFVRDNWTCIWCKKRGVKLNADHIKPFAYFPELRLSLENGRTLCEDCHKTTDTYKARAKKYIK